MLSVLITACSSGGQASTQQLVTVTRGDIEVSASGNGKVEAVREAKLDFGSGGKVEMMVVKEGDLVTEGQILAQLDLRPLELALIQAQSVLDQAETGLAQAEHAKYTAELSLKNTKESQDTLEMAVLNAQISFDMAEDALVETYKTYDWDTFQVLESDLNKAKAYYDYALDGLENATDDTLKWELLLDKATAQRDAAQANYDNFLAGKDSDQIALKKNQVEAAKLALSQAQRNLDDLPDNIVLQEKYLTAATKGLDQARQTVTLAQKSLEESQRQYDKATIVAPFNGVVAAVVAEEGDNVLAPSLSQVPVIQMIDPEQLEILVAIDELDIPRVELEQRAIVTLDALPDSTFNGTVIAVYPTPNEISGVVLYNVRLSLEASADSGIKVGMSADADIMIEESSSVLVVPSRAVMLDADGNTIVKVKTDDQIEERPVVVGLDDGLRVEIISGLAEGETVVLESRNNSSSVSLFG